MGTENDLKAAFAGESQANRKYTAFSRKADEEGYPQVAKLFRAAAAAETVHALTWELVRSSGLIRGAFCSADFLRRNGRREEAIVLPQHDRLCW